ncbi:MAG: hypothetical protein R6V03_08970 [Kiritimatiellia bacterium]
MSQAYDKMKSQQVQKHDWYLKTADGLVYGPVTLDKLIEWARQGRVSPSARVSSDSTTWLPPEEVPELKMEWYLQAADGEAEGPFNLLAIPSLVESRCVPRDGVLTNKHTRKEVTVESLLKSSSPTGETQESSPTRRSQEHHMSALVAELTEEVQTKTQTIDQLEEKVSALEKEQNSLKEKLDKETSAHHRAQAKAEEAEKHLAKVISDVSDDHSVAAASHDRVAAELEEWRNKYKALDKYSSENEHRFKERISGLEKKAAEFDCVTADLKSRIGELQEKTTSIQSVLAERRNQVEKKITGLASSAVAVTSALAQSRAYAQDRDRRFAQASENFRGNTAQQHRRLADIVDRLQKHARNVTTLLAKQASNAEERIKQASSAKKQELTRRIKALESEKERLQGALTRERTEAETRLRDTLSTRDKQASAKIKAIESAGETLAAGFQRLGGELDSREKSYAKLKQSCEEKTNQLAGRIDDLQARARSAEDKLAKAQEDAAREKNRGKALSGREQDLTEKLKSLESEKGRLEEALSEERAGHQEKVKEALAAREKEVAAKIDELQMQADGLEKSLADERARGEKQLAEAVSAKEKELAGKLTSLQAEKEELQSETAARIKKLGNDVPSLTHQLEKVTRERDEAHRTAEKDITRLKARLHEFEGDKADVEWHLKLDDGTVYGPVPLCDLRSWAEDCRIGPQHEVSPDKKKWFPASQVPELRMDWMVEIDKDNSYGPLNLLAVANLLDDGTITPETEVSHKTGDTTLRAEATRASQVTELAESREHIAAEVKALKQSLADEREKVKELEDKIKNGVDHPSGSVLPPKAITKLTSGNTG